MKKLWLLITLCSISFHGFAQQGKAANRYRLRNNRSLQDTVYLKIGSSTKTLEKGWTVTETIGGKTVQRTLTKPETITVKTDAAIKVTGKWKIGEVKHTDDNPGVLTLNPYSFTDKKNAYLNTTYTLKIPENGYISLRHSYFRWNAITIPFVIRKALNDTIGSKITTDLKIGASFSYNLNWEKFKNRRIVAKKSVYGVSGGIGFGLSKVTLDASSTSLSDTPYSHTEDGLALFLAPGLGFNLKGFQFTVSYGWDIPITENVKDWNYANEGWIGIGLGVDLNVFGEL